MINIEIPSSETKDSMKDTCLAMLTIYEFLARGHTTRPSLRSIGKYIDRQWPRKGNTSSSLVAHYIESLESSGDITQIKINGRVLYRVSVSRTHQLDILGKAFYEAPSRNNS